MERIERDRAESDDALRPVPRRTSPVRFRSTGVRATSGDRKTVYPMIQMRKISCYLQRLLLVGQSYRGVKGT